MIKNKITRRDLIKKSALAAVGSALYFNMPKIVFANKTSKTKVILIRNKNVIDDNGIVNSNIIKEMLDEAVVTLTGKSDISQSWATIFNKNDIVGIKTNEWHNLHTPLELEEAIKNRIIETGVNSQNISIKDRGVLNDDVFKNATALVNVRPIRTHYWAGVGSLIKNYIMFSEKPSSYHPDTCADLGALWKLPIVEGKTKLNILVMLTPLFHGVGPHHFNKEYTWKYNGLLVGFDPVAVDSVGIRILQEKRRQYFGEDRPINPPPKHIFIADTKYKIGTADPNKIELISLGWKNDILI